MDCVYRISSSDGKVDLVMGYTGLVEGVSHSKLNDALTNKGGAVGMMANMEKIIKGLEMHDMEGWRL